MSTMLSVDVRARQGQGPQGTPLTEEQEARVIEALAERAHLSACWRAGRPTPKGYVWEFDTHEPAAPHTRCARLLEDVLDWYPAVKAVLEDKEEDI